VGRLPDIGVAQLKPLLASQGSALLHGSLWGFVAKVLSALIALGFNVVIARKLGADGLGAFFVGVAVMSVSSVIARLGLDNAIIRHAAGLKARSQWNALREMYRVCAATTVVSGLIVSLALFFLAGPLTKLFFAEGTSVGVLQAFAIAIPAFSVIHMNARFFQSIDKIGLALFAQTAAVPVVMLLLLALVPGEMTVALTASYYILSTAVVAFTCWLGWRRIAAKWQNSGSEALRFGEVFRSSRYLYATAIVEQILQPWAASLFLAVFASTTDVGWFAAASRAAAIITFAIVPINVALAPRLSALWTHGEQSEFLRLCRLAMAAMVVVGVPMLIMVLLFAENIMSVFGADFAGAESLLLILAIGQLFNVITGPVRSMLIMTGREKVFRVVSLTGGAANLSLCLLLIPALGAEGAAWSATASIALTNTLAAILVWRKVLVPIAKSRKP